VSNNFNGLDPLIRSGADKDTCETPLMTTADSGKPIEIAEACRTALRSAECICADDDNKIVREELKVTVFFDTIKNVGKIDGLTVGGTEKRRVGLPVGSDVGGDDGRQLG
jgi:hypothetical protein